MASWADNSKLSLGLRSSEGGQSSWIDFPYAPFSFQDMETGTLKESVSVDGGDQEVSSDPFDIPQAKHLLVERFRRWRQAALVLNASRRFRYTSDLTKDEEKERRRRMIRAHAQVIRLAGEQKFTQPSSSDTISQEQHPCPRCCSTITTHFFDVSSLCFCKYCHRDWNHDGTLRNTPVGGGSCKKAKRCCMVTSATSNINANTSASQDYPLHETPVSGQLCGGGNGKGNNGILSVPTVEDHHQAFPTNKLSETCPECQKKPIFVVKPGADIAAGRLHHHIINASSPGRGHGKGSFEDGVGPFHTIQVDESDDVPLHSIESDPQALLASTSTAVASDRRDERPPSDRSQPPRDRSPSNTQNAASIAEEELGWDLYDLVKIFLPISAALGFAIFAVRYSSGKSPSEKAKILQSLAEVCSVVAFLLLSGGYFIPRRAPLVGRCMIVGGAVVTTIAIVLLMGSLLADI